MGHAAGADGESVNILIVDDRPSNIVTLEAILNRPDYRLVSVTSGAEALRHVLETDFAVILLDVMMPEMDGFEFARLVRQRPRAAATPIIFLTAIATDMTYLLKGYEVGAVDYLPKPLIPEIVCSKVSVFVELFRKSRRLERQEAELREIQRLEQERRLEEVRRAGERHYLELADSIPHIVWIASATGEPRYLNRKWTEYTGLTLHDTKFGSDAERLVHSHDLPALIQAWNDAVAAQAAFEVPVRLRHGSSGAYRWHLCRGMPERCEDGALVGWLGTFTDIDRLKRIENAQRFLAEASARLSEPDDLAAGFSALAEALAPELVDACLIDVAVPDLLTCRLAVGRPESELADGMHSVENPRLGENAAVAPLIVRGAPCGAIGLFAFERPVDETDLNLAVETCRHAAVVIENALVRAETAAHDRRKDEFLAVLSHELRTPLNAMIGWTELLRADAEHQELRDGLGIVENNAKALAQLVADLLDVSRIVTGQMTVHCVAMDLNAFIAGVAAAAKPLAEAKGIAMTAVITAPKVSIMGDKDRLQQAVWNLISNAIKFTPSGGDLELSLSAEDGSAYIQVKDSGIGIDATVLPEVFDRFRQADSSRTRRHGGLGLGLSIVKHLAASHGGEVTAASDGIGKGAVFTIKLPLIAAAEIDEGDPVDLSRTLRGLEGTHLLLVDDDDSSRTLIATLLRHSGASVSVACSVREAMVEVGRARPDAVITDIGMPDEDGFALLERIRAFEREARCRIGMAALTAYASDDDRKAALAAGFHEYLTKPIRASELVRAVASLTGRGGLA